jgi:hypothetical protein
MFSARLRLCEMCHSVGPGPISELVVIESLTAQSVRRSKLLSVCHAWGGISFPVTRATVRGPLPPRFRLRSRARVIYILPFHGFGGLAAMQDPINTGHYALTPAVR